ncbi:ribonuclease P protein component [Tumebacillus algifaecis]|uniref:Ribonuclease P protein component n=1 Tax=Tumebacillus algifaecis TaxID=1214604 RepID=A0A223CWL7_9BACL|nr:ribonuclease P protein component [Tumebacillus algifaecis]ASS73553.1 ribonuclease P protein component [Tumebacillus algifaecis]
MLQKEHRLTDKRDFQRVFHHGQSFANRYLVIYFLKNRNSDTFRVGFSVSKKVGKAVTRNRVKRLLREAFRSSRDQIKEAYDLVVIARPSAAELEYENVVQNVHHLLRNMDKPDAQKRKPQQQTRRSASDKQGERKKGVH